LNKKVVEQIFSAGLKIYTWTVNDDKQIEKMKQLGVNGIITDYPERI
jgi:glycerophosphoryl diester phosphodiesterase